MSKEIEALTQFLGAINNQDVNTAIKFFTADAVYHNMPLEPVEGPQAIRAAMERFLKPATEVDWQVLNIAQVGDRVLTERIDRFKIVNKWVELPVMGTFDFRDGKIKAWRDYFDLATWTKQMQA